MARVLATEDHALCPPVQFRIVLAKTLIECERHGITA